MKYLYQLIQDHIANKTTKQDQKLLSLSHQ